MIFVIAINPNLPNFVLLGLIIIGLSILLRYFKQPYAIAYILAGIALGEHGLAVITDEAMITEMGEIGLILLLFFIGMEINLPDLLKKWKLAGVGTVLQILVSVLLAILIGSFFDWPMNRSIVMGFVISLSSSAVVIKLLQDGNEIQSPTGQDVISILLMQDILIVPMLIMTSYLGGQELATHEIILQLVGGVTIIGLIFWIAKKETITLPYNQHIEADHELQVFVAFIFCFGFAFLTALFGLSAALGAFVGGMVVHAARSTEWFHDSLHSFRVIFVALFFVSVGMLIDLQFIYENGTMIGLIIIAVYLSNHFINAGILRYFGRSWKNSLYGGALLAQVGELSFVLMASAYQAGIVSDFSYQLTIVVIALTLLISPFWIAATKKLLSNGEILSDHF
ncbi:MAG: CPA2 family monovalent cation:H+ antiporter-2 [Paraglaciecola sp.]|jgi:CPA2 family monovalent cation:H+ antiporter-2